MIDADRAAASARDGGFGVDHVAELIRYAAEPLPGSDRLPGVGHLHGWLTGRAPPPLDAAEAARRREVRQGEAEAIRDAVRREAAERSSPQAPEVIAGITARRLQDAGLGDQATAAEHDADAKLAAWDARRTERAPPAERSRREAG